MVKYVSVCVRVIDGDTFVTDTDVTIRLARVDTPKSGTPTGDKAKAQLSDMILGKPITYESVATDHYGRTVAEVWVDGDNVNDYMRSLDYIPH